ncbi:MAG: alpha/beta fold hydrolase, partial [Bacteroidota bacterium]
MKVVQHILFLLLLSPMWLLAQTESLQPIDPLYPEEWTGAGVEWYRLTVPQDRAKPADKQVKLAIAILKKTKADATAKPVLFLEGGPGGSGIEGIWNFLEHPMRAHSDIVLVDVRGSGFSEPRLCPDLGNEFLQIFAKDQGPEEMEKEKIAAAMACRQSMIGKGIDWKMYNSKVIVQDLEDLRRALGHDQWQVYGVSYGTYVAQVYAEDHPMALQSMILDSSIPDIHKYYNSNSTKFLGAMQKVFDHCDADPDCKSAYPQLKEQFFATIAQLKEQAIEVEVDQQIVESGTFAYNAEDFKVAIQQSLYDERMVAVMPLLIQAFHDGNKETLGSLVQAFSRALVLDYGLYYCMSCAEAVPR